MPAVLITGLTATQNSPFLFPRWPKHLPVLIAPTHGGTARLSGPFSSPEDTGMVEQPKVITNPFTYPDST